MVYRSQTEVGTFPTMESVQTDHVCDLVFPAGVDASEIAIQAVEAVQGYGLFGVELFELEDGSFQVNEIAPRPHNTGHYTLDWGGVSQFEQHVRLVMGWPCAKPEGQPTCMANLLGQPGAGDYQKGLEAALQGDADVHVHWYGKVESRPGRKMGHINVTGEKCVERAKAARERFYGAWTTS
jgi:5-(carboxyamino)imidazole ribonucleotide synthase